MADAEQFHGISADDWPDFTKLMRDYRGGRLGAKPAPAPPPRPPAAGESCVVVLAQDLDGSSVVPAERLVMRTDFIGLDLQMLGFPNNPTATFQITIDNQQTDMISVLATADDVYNAIAELPVSRQALYAVTLGNQVERGIVTMRWRLALFPKPEQPGLSFVPEWNVSVQSGSVFLISKSLYHGTGEFVDVHSTVPVGTPTPLRCGSQAACVRIPGAGWGVVACEPRKYVQAVFTSPGS